MYQRERPPTSGSVDATAQLTFMRSGFTHGANQRSTAVHRFMFTAVVKDVETQAALGGARKSPGLPK